MSGVDRMEGTIIDGQWTEVSGYCGGWAKGNHQCRNRIAMDTEIPSCVDGILLDHLAPFLAKGAFTHRKSLSCM